MCHPHGSISIYLVYIDKSMPACKLKSNWVNASIFAVMGSPKRWTIDFNVHKLNHNAELQMKLLPWEPMGWASAYYCGIHHRHRQIVPRGIQVLTPLWQNKIPCCSVLTQVPVIRLSTISKPNSDTLCLKVKSSWTKSTYLQIHNKREKPFFRGYLYRQLKTKAVNTEYPVKKSKINNLYTNTVPEAH